MADAALLVLLDEVGGKTVRLLKSTPDDDVRWAPAGLQNTILWHGGHAYILLEWLTMHALGQTPRIPDGWYEMFSWDSHPDQVLADRWPARVEVIAKLEEQHERMKRLFGKLSDAQLKEPSARRAQQAVFRTIVHALHDEACHCGEIHLLRKLKALKAVRD
jgi:hypothetical protein